MDSMTRGVAAIITAAGESARMGGVKKEYRFLEGQTVLAAAAAPFASLAGTIAVTHPAGGRDQAEAALGPLAGRALLVEGGASRQDSVYAALLALEAEAPAWVLIHDGARPWVTAALIRRVLGAAQKHGAAIPVLPVTETVKEIGAAGFVTGHPRRAALVTAQTPQAFAYGPLLAACRAAASRLTHFTDDAEVWASLPENGPVFTVPGEERNRKITFPADLP